MSRKIILLFILLLTFAGFLFFIQGKFTQKTVSTKKNVAEKIRITYSSTVPAILIPIIGAKEGGFLAKYNVEVDLIQSKRITDALTSNSADVAISNGMFSILGAAAGGYDLVWIATLTRSTSDFLISRVPKEKIQRVGTTSIGSLNYYTALIALKTLGVDSQKITMIPLVDNQGMSVALDKGYIDAVRFRGPDWLAYQAAHPQNKLIAYSLADTPTNLAVLNGVSLTARGEAVKKNPEVFSNLIAALLEGSVYVKQHPDVIEGVLTKDYQLSPATVKATVKDYINSLKDITVVPDLSMATVAAQLMIADFKKIGSYDINNFVNTNIAKEALTKVDFNKIKAELSK